MSASKWREDRNVWSCVIAKKWLANDAENAASQGKLSADAKFYSLFLSKNQHKSFGERFFRGNIYHSLTNERRSLVNERHLLLNNYHSLTNEPRSLSNNYHSLTNERRLLTNNYHSLVNEYRPLTNERYSFAHIYWFLYCFSSPFSMLCKNNAP